VESARLRAACVAVSGILAADGRIADSFAVPEWNGAPVAEEFESLLGCGVTLENDIKLSALAEHHMGAAQDVDDIVFVQIGNRISIALTLDRTIFQGRHRSAGEVGSLRGMRWASNSVRGELTWRTGASAEEVLGRAERGDAEALAEVRTFIEEIAPLLTTVTLVADPDRIIIGGGLSRAGGLFVDMLRERIHHLIVLDVDHEVMASSLGSIGAACGALALAFQTGSADLFGYPGVSVPPISPPR
jgi:predicted NBD/HSP70 family sugar kinase